MTLPSTIALGFLLGMRHATDPDHVVAVTTIVTRHRSMRYASLIGALWGAGHTVTIAVVGSAIILFGWVIPPRLGLSMEFSVALMLVLLGVMNLTGFLPWIRSRISEDSSGRANFTANDSGHSHRHHSHRSIRWLDRHLRDLGLYQIVRPLIIGLVHGLAGSAAIALMVMATIRDPRWALVYLLVFGVGTIGGMVLVTAAIGLPSVRAGNASPRLGSWLRISSGVISLVFGLLMAYQIGVGDGLFGGHPKWTPQ
jgi:ABC-type nickel/cobalt efflux system permease component RcnA